MALMVLVVLSVAGFLNIESRIAVANLARQQARLNAIASAREAIGVLQQELGPDQRITASAGLLDANPDTADLTDGSAAGPLYHPNWTGSWNSYRPGLKRDSEYDSVGKGTASTKRLERMPSYEKAGLIGSERTFRRWLVSSGYDATWDAANPDLAIAAGLRTDNSAPEALKAMRGAWTWNGVGAANGAQLLGAGTLGPATAASTAYSARADAPLVPFPAGEGAAAGRFAWWASDNAQRATIGLPARAAPTNTWERVQAVFAPDRPVPEVPAPAAGATPLALQGATTRTANGLAYYGFNAAKAATAPSFSDLAGAMTLADAGWKVFWLDYTTTSRGVLACPLNGDLKADINLLLENPGRVNAPSRHIDIGAVSSPINAGVTGNWYDYAVLDTIDEARNYLFYFHRQAGSEGTSVSGITSPFRPYRGTSWTDIWRWYQSYKPEENRSLSGLTPRRSVPVPISTHYDPHQGLDKYDMLDYPRYAKVQYVYSYTSQPYGTQPDGSPAYRLGISFVPVITLWNPFNYRLEFPDPTIRGGVSAAIKCAGMPVGFHVGFRRWDAATGTYGATAWVTPSSPSVPPQGQRWVHTSFFATQTWLSNFSQESPVSKLVLNPGEALVTSPKLTGDYVKTTGSNDGFAAYPGYNPVYGIVNYGDTIGTGDGYIYNRVTPVGSWAWKGGANDLVVIQPYYSDHTSNSAWGYSETAVDFWTDNGWPVQEYRGAYITSFKGAIEGPTGQNTIKINYNPAKFRSVSLQACAGTKIPFMSMSLYLKSEQGTSAAGRQYPNLAFLHSNLVSRNQTLDASQRDLLWLRNVGVEFYIDQLFGSWDTDAVQVDASNRGFVGSGLTAENGARYWAAVEQPYWPMVSMAQMQNVQMGNQGLGSWRTLGTWISGGSIDFAFGNSAGYPGIPVDAVVNTGTDSAHSWNPSSSYNGARFFIDHAYLANWSGWDYYFCSSATRQDTAGFAAHGTPQRDLAQVMDEFRRGVKALPNPRLTWIRNTGESTDKEAWERIFVPTSVPFVATGIPAGTTREGDKCQIDAHARLARNLLLEGAFNVNSTSKEAWRALLFASRGKSVTYDRTSAGAPGTVAVEDLSTGTVLTPFPRFSMPLGPCADRTGREEDFWCGFRALTDAQIDALAEEIVKEVKRRGPFLSLGEFVNRRVAPRSSGPTDWFARQAGRATATLADNKPEARGALQAAIDRTDANARFQTAARSYTTAQLTAADPTLPGMANAFLTNASLANFPENSSGSIAKAYGSNGFLMQADVLNVIGTFLTVRGDTLTVRCMGESTRGESRAYCEIVLQRLPEYVRHLPPPPPGTTYPPLESRAPCTPDDPDTNWSRLTHPTNRALGRRFRVVSFRWISPSEI